MLLSSYKKDKLILQAIVTNDLVMMKIAEDFYCQKVGNLVGTVTFLCDFLNMEIVKEQYEKGVCTLLEKSNGTLVFLSEEVDQIQLSTIHLKTKDCIEQYCTLKSMGVVFTQEPKYTPEGLMAQFLDPYGNRYVLLEARKYND